MIYGARATSSGVTLIQYGDGAVKLSLYKATLLTAVVSKKWVPMENIEARIAKAAELSEMDSLLDYIKGVTIIHDLLWLKEKHLAELAYYKHPVTGQLEAYKPTGMVSVYRRGE